MSNRLTHTESKLQEKLAGYEAPYDPGPWEDIEKELDARKTTSNVNKKVKTAAAIVGGVLAIALGIYGISKIEGDTSTATVKETKDKGIIQTPTQGSSQSGKPEDQDKGKGNGVVTETDDPQSSTSDKDHGHPGTKEEKKKEKAGIVADKSDPSSFNGEMNSSENKGGNEITEDNRDNTTDPDEESLPPLKVGFTVSAKEGCKGLEATFRSEVNEQKVDHLWDFGDGEYSNKKDPTHTFNEPGTYTVSLTVTGREKGRTRSVRRKDVITVHGSPEASIDWRIERKGDLRPKVSFTAHADNIDEYSWNFGDGESIETRSSSAEHTFQCSGAYPVTLRVRNENGCTDTVQKVFELEKSFNLFAPNAFTPNGDGRNDVFLPKSLKIMDVNFTMTIHDPRSGRMIFKTHDTSRPWNGRIHNNGRKVQTGNTFLWVVVLEDPECGEETYKGQITVLE